MTFGFTPRGEAQLLAHGVSVVEPPPRSGPDWAKPRDMLRVEPEWLRQTIRAGGEVSPPTKLKDFAADYPPIAWFARVQGTVTADVLVGPDGRVQDAYVVVPVTHRNNARLVYSTGTGGKCHVCGWPQRDCQCSSRRAPTDAVPARVVAKLRTEKKGRGGKTVTVVYDLPRNAQFLQALSQDLKRACGTGGTVIEGGVELQGDLRERVRDALMKRGIVVKG